MFWTGGNENFFRLGTMLGGRAGVSVEYYRLLESDRGNRFKTLGLINEPNCRKAEKADQYGLMIDVWDKDPGDYYPDVKVYGEPTGIVGLRKFPNPKFDAAKWNRDRYFQKPWEVEPPYLIGMSCGFCHIGFDPRNPPADPERPRWDNLAANMGNQYLREGQLFLGEGKIVFGNENGGKGLGPDSFLYQYARSQQPGTSETSRLSYDFINNPNMINPIFYLPFRATFEETTPDGVKHKVQHILKEGADSVGIPMASCRVYVNIGMEGQYWVTRLWNPLTGQKQRPFEIDKVRGGGPNDGYGPDFGKNWRDAESRMIDVESYLSTYLPARLKDAPGGQDFLKADAATLERGKVVFADNCARCHSNKQPFYPLKSDSDIKGFYRSSVLADSFLDHNTLTDDKRYPVSDLGTNMARSLASNATEGHVWEQFSSRDYKSQPKLAPVKLSVRMPSGEVISTTFSPPGGGRGYYRTPTLVSMWATAPYFHNNSLGVFNNDPSVKGSMAAFDDGVRKLLWPERRPGRVKLTNGETTLDVSIPALEDALVGMVMDKVRAGLPGVSSKLGIKEALLRAELEKATTKLMSKVRIPAGIPINLIANINVDNAAYALAAVLTSKSKQELAQRLLDLSDCPDLIEDKGHLYGSDLSDDEKNALIEFLKTF